MAQSLQGKTAVVTGAAKRLGRATALALAAEGANLVLHYHTSADEAEAVRAQAQALGVTAWLVQADLGAPDAAEELVSKALAAAGTVDLLVNNASIFPTSMLDTVNLDQVVENLTVNAWSPFAICRAFARQVGQGKIVNMLDARLAGYDWLHVAYILSKHTLATLTRMMAVQYAPRITVNAVAPGLVLPPPGKDESYLQGLVGSIPLRQHGSAQDIADAVLFLLKSAFITGEVIYVDGGRHLLEHQRGPDSHQ